MAKRAVEHIFTGATTPYTSYDSTKTNLGQLIQQRTGLTAIDKFAGPMPIGLARPMEATTAIPGIYPHVLAVDSDTHWVFLADNATAANTRRIVKYTYTISTGSFVWDGYITVTFPTATAHTIRGFRMSRDQYTTGSASVSGTAVSGTGGTAWQASNIAVGTRIGFGSTDPTQISTWYEIASVNSATSITLVATAGTISSGPYVIDELRALITTTNATATNGGLYVVKGLREVIFKPIGTTIAAATTVDGLRAVYWLADASTVTNTVVCGLAISDKDSWTQQYVYCIDGTTTTNRVYKYNVRATLASLASGKSLSAYVFVTAASTPTGTCSQANNGRLGVLNHGPGSGTPSLYFTTTTRVYRASLTDIYSGNSGWQSDVMVEVPPGGSSTYPLTSALNSVEIADTIDRLVVMSSGSAGARSYVTKYNTNSDPFDHIFTGDDKQYDQSSADSGAVAHPAIGAAAFSIWAEAGICYMARIGTTAIVNQLYALPLGAHWTYAGSSPFQRLVTPALSTSDATSLYRVYVNSSQQIGSGTMGLPPEPYRMYYRTSGITDDSGTWNLLDDSHDLTGISPGASIQFMFEFKILGITCVPARIYNLTVTYEDSTTDSHYQPSVAQSDKTNKRFAWRFSTAFGSTVPTLKIRLYDAVTGGLLLTDSTVSSTGTFEKSTNDGGSWSAYDTTDKANETTYIRYTPASLGDNIKVRALLTQN